MEEICKIILVMAGGGATVVLTPAMLAALGFTSGGIAAGSLAAKMMSYFGANFLVSLLQSTSMAGLSWWGTGFFAGTGGYAASLISTICNVTVTT